MKVLPMNRLRMYRFKFPFVVFHNFGEKGLHLGLGTNFVFVFRQYSISLRETRTELLMPPPDIVFAVTLEKFYHSQYASYHRVRITADPQLVSAYT